MVYDPPKHPLKELHKPFMTFVIQRSISASIAVYKSKRSRLDLVLDITKLILFLATALDFVGNKLLVLLQALLDMQLETNNVVKHALNLSVKLFPKSVSPQLELLVSFGKLATTLNKWL